jgi:hypothetical protein
MQKRPTSFAGGAFLVVGSLESIAEAEALTKSQTLTRVDPTNVEGAFKRRQTLLRSASGLP